jgi:hypothetical protein
MEAVPGRSLCESMVVLDACVTRRKHECHTKHVIIGRTLVYAPSTWSCRQW